MAEEISKRAIIAELETRFTSSGSQDVKKTTDEVVKNVQDGNKKIVESNKEVDKSFVTQGTASRILSGELKKQEEVSKNAAKAADNFANSNIKASDVINTLSSKSAELAGKIHPLGRILGNISDGLKGFSQRAGELSGGFGRLGGLLLRFTGVAAGAVGALAAIVAIPLAAFFASTEEGANRLQDTMAGFQNVGNRVVGIFGEIGKNIVKIIDGIAKLDAELIKEGLFSKIDTNLSGAFSEGAKLSETTRILRENNILRLENIAKNEIIIKQQKEILAAESNTLANVNKKYAALGVLQKKSIENANEKKQIAQDELFIAESNLILKGKTASAEDKRAVFSARIELLKADEDLKNVGVTVAKTRKTIDNEAERINDSIEKLKKSLLAINFDILKGETLGTDNLELDLIVNFKDKDKARFEIQELISFYTSELERIESESKKLKIDLDTSDIENKVIKLKSQLEKLLEIDVSIKPLIRTKEPLKLDTPDILPGLKPEQNKEGDKREQLIKQAARDSINAILDVTKAFEEAEIRKTEILIQQQELRVERARDIAAKGNAEQLQLEEERLDKLLQARAEAVERQDQLNKIQATSQAAVNVVQLIGAIVGEAGKTSIYSAIAGGIALVATIAGLVAQIKGFKEGTDYVHGPGGHKDDKVLTRLSRGEMVLEYETAQKVRDMGISRKQIPHYVKLGYLIENQHTPKPIISTSYLKPDATYVTNNTVTNTTIIKEVASMLDAHTKTIQDTLVRIEFNDKGWYARMEKRNKHEKLVKNILR